MLATMKKWGKDEDKIIFLVNSHFRSLMCKAQTNSFLNVPRKLTNKS